MTWDGINSERQRLDNEKKLGLITDSAELSPRGAGVKPWNQLTAD